MSDYPNIEAIAAGTISGAFREWPKVRQEARALLADLRRLQAAELDALCQAREAEDRLARLLLSSCSLCQGNRARAAQAEAKLSAYETETPLGQALMDGSEE